MIRNVINLLGGVNRKILQIKKILHVFLHFTFTLIFSL